MKTETKRQKLLFQGNWVRPALAGVLINLIALSSVFAEGASAARLLFLGNQNIAPVVYLDKASPTGVAVDIVRALAPHLPQPIEIRAIDWPQAQALVARGEADALIQINQTEEREKIYDFSEPLLESQFSIFTRTDKVGIAGIASLAGLQVGVEAGGLPRQLLEKFPAIRLTIIPDFLAGFKLLNAGAIDAVVVDYRVGSYVIAENKLRDIRISGEPVAFSYSAIAVKEGNTQLLAAINSALKTIKADGSYQRVIDKWKPKEVVFETREQIRHRVYSLAILVLLVLFLIAAIWTLTLRRELVKRRVAEERLRQQYSTSRGIINSANALIFSVDRQYRYTSFNQGHAASMKALYGAEIELGHSVLDYMSVTEDRDTARHNLDRALAGEQVVEEAFSGEELRSRQYFQVSHSPIRSEEGVIGVAVLAQDMSERRRAEEATHRLNRELRAISDCNQVLVRAQDEPTLLNDICRIVCEEAGYRMACVGYAENDAAKTVKPVAWAGVEQGYLADANITWADTERGHGPGGTAIRSGAIVCVQDFATDPQTAPWRDAALQRGYRSCIALPLKDDGAKVFGIFLIYSAEINAFSPDEIRLLDELSGDLAFGITVLRTRVKRQQAEESLYEAQQVYRALIEYSPDIIARYDRDCRRTYVNPMYLKVAQMPRQGLLASAPSERSPLPAAGATVLQDLLRRVLDSGVAEAIDVVWPKADNIDYWYNIYAFPELDREGRVVSVMTVSRDITARKQAQEALTRKERYYRKMIEGGTEVFFLIDRSGTLLYRSESGKQITGWDTADVLGRPITDFVPAQSLPLVRNAMAEALAKPDQTIRVEARWRRKDGTQLDAEALARNLLDDPDVGGIVITARDISGRKLAEQELRRLNRALRTLSACNEALVRAITEAELLDAICRLVVETGGYSMAWVGFPEPDAAKTVRPVAQYGHDDGFLATANISWADCERGRGPSGMAIRTGAVQVNQEFLTDPGLLPWRQAALERGYQSVIALPLKSAAATLGVLTLYAAATDAFNEAEVTLLQELAGDLAFGIETLRTRAERDRIASEHRHHEETLRQSLEESIKAIANTVEMRDPYTAGHQRRVGQLAVAIAKELGLPEDTNHGIELAAGIHDLGKISIPAEILTKPSRLSGVEYMLLKNHPQAGFDILKDIKFPWPIASMVLQHHERVDGSGYPQGLRGEQILLESRILAVADVVESMASHRPYRPALGVDSALKEMARGRGTVYDAAVVDACLRLFTQKQFVFSS
ncbi:MAG: GAF domain-containing protein [Rhodoferax sp.]|uniref:GAF domain-containing protein n=1 Tax=Rhodoferax sp. TaxID=50421 RepID=UPI0026112853|nr:transporter substrate-binding domain-containing protein [Rhodoferax sp.]MDD5332563.1 GAF domain-containing protein [Rhodoferax sp.]